MLTKCRLTNQDSALMAVVQSALQAEQQMLISSLDAVSSNPKS
jgi:hypothetical protein